MHQYYVGLDVHSKQSTFVIADGAGTVVAEGEVPTTPAGLKEWCARQASPSGTPVALETGTTAFFVARQLSTVGMAPVVVDAHEVRLKAHRPTCSASKRFPAWGRSWPRRWSPCLPMSSGFPMRSMRRAMPA